MDTTRFPELIRDIYAAVDELEQMFPGRHFTPDGHMVGSIGEAIAAYYYGIELLPASAKRHDGKVNGRRVQVKTTQGKRIAISSEPQYLLVLQLTREGDFREIYSGPGSHVWARVSGKPVPKNGQYQVGLSTLSRLMELVPDDERIQRVRPIDPKPGGLAHGFD
mgnify:CR=1 FL=1